MTSPKTPKLPMARIALAAGISIVIAAAVITSGFFVKNFPPSLDELYPGMQQYSDFMPTFGLDTTLTVMAEEPADFSIEGLTALDKLTKVLSEAENEGIRHVRSLTNLPSIHLDAEGEVETGNLVKALPKTKAELDALKPHIRKDKNAVGALISPDFKMYTLVVAVSKTPDMQKISSLIDANRGNLKIHLYGAPAIAADMQSTVADSIPLAAGILALLFLAMIIGGFLLMPQRSTGRFIVLLVLPLLLLGLWSGIVTVWGISGFSAFPVALVSIFAVVLHLLQGRTPARSALLKSIGAMAVSGVLLIIVNGFLVQSIGIALLSLSALLIPFVWLITPQSVLTSGHGLASGEQAKHIQHLRIGVAAFGVVLTIGLISFLQVTGNPQDMYRSPTTVATANAMAKHNGGNQYIHISLHNKNSKDPMTLEVAQVLYRYLKHHPQVVDVRSPSAIFLDLNLNMNHIQSVPITTGEVGDIGFFLDGNPDFEALATPDFTSMQVIATPRKGFENAVVDDIRGFTDDLKAVLNNRSALLEKRWDLLLTAVGISAKDIPRPAIADIYKQPSMRHKAATRLNKALMANMMPVIPKEDITANLAPLMGLPSERFRTAYEKMTGTFEGIEEFPEEFKDDYFALVEKRRAAIDRHLWAETVLERMSPDLYRTKSSLYQSLKGILVTAADPVFAQSLKEAPKASTVSMALLGLPVISRGVQTNSRSAMLWTLLLILLPLVFFDQWRSGIGALLASVMTLLAASLVSLAGIPISPLALMFVACMPAAAMALNASFDNRQLYRYQAWLAILGGVFFFAAGLLLPFAAEVFLVLGMVLAAMGGWMRLKSQTIID